MWRRFSILLALLAGVLAGVALLLQSREVAGRLGAYLERLAAERLDVDLRIGSLKLELWPPRVLLFEVAASLPGQPSPTFGVARVAAAIDPWPAATGAFVISRLEVDGLLAKVDLLAARSLFAGTADEERGGAGAGVDIKTLIVRDAAFELTRGDEQLSLSEVEVSLRPVGEGRRDLRLRVGAGRVVVAGRESTGFLELTARLFGTLDRPRAIELDAFTLGLGAARLSGEGTLALLPAPRAKLALALRGPLAPLFVHLPELTGLDGLADLTLEVEGPLVDLRAAGRLSIADLAVAGKLVGELACDLTLSRDKLELLALSLTGLEAGRVTGRATLGLAGALPVTAKLALDEVSLPVVLELAGLEGAFVAGRIKGDVAVRGALAPLGFKLGTELLVTDFRVLDQSFRAAGAETMLHLGPTTLAGEVAIDEEAVSFDDLALVRGEAAGRIRARFPLEEPLGMHLEYTSPSFSFAEIGDIAGLAFTGKGSLTATVSGPFTRLLITSALDLRDFSAAGYAIGEVRGGLVFDELVLTARRLEGRHAGGTFVADASLDFGAEGIGTRGEVTLTGAALAELLATIGLLDGGRDLVDAEVSATATLGGTLAAPDLELALEGPRLAISGAELGALSLFVAYAGEQETLSLKLATRTSKSSIAAEATLASGGELTLAAELSLVPAQSLAKVMGGGELTGALSGTAALAGSVAALSGRAELWSKDLAAYERALGPVRLVGEFTKGELVLSGTTHGGAVGIEAKALLAEEVPYSALIRFADLELAHLLPGIDGVSAVLTGSLFSQGKLMRPESIEADAVIERARITALGVAMAPLSPLRLQYVGGALRVSDFTLQGVGLSLTLRGEVAASGALAVGLRGVAELESARLGFADFAMSRGHLELDLSLSGTVSDPYLVGEVRLEDGLVRSRSRGIAIEETEGRLVLRGRSLTVERLTGRVGGGQLAVGGQVTWPRGHALDVDLSATLRDVGLRPDPDLKLALSGELRLQGAPQSLQLRGELELESLRYTANIDLEELIPKRGAPPLAVPALASEDAVGLNVKIRAKDSVLVQSPVLDAELHADLVITGERVGLVGSVAPLWARARYQDNVFEVERASILFTDEHKIAAEFDLAATTSACGMRIAVAVVGSSDGYNVVPSGTDENGPVVPQDVLACLQFGLRLRDLRGAQQDGAFSDRLATSGIDALWTVSGLDQQVRRILPIVDELRISSGWSQRSKRTTPRVVVGKELGERLQLTYSRALDGEDDQAFAVAYKMNELATLLGSWNTGSEAQLGDLGLDLRLRWEFQ